MSSEEYFERYGDLELQRRMVGDARRTDAFAESIAETVRKGDVVLDLGTGTGILAMLAARAGASRVYAIDGADISHAAARVVEANGLSDIIDVRHGLASGLRIDGQVDVVVSEWLGNFTLAESMLDDVLSVRDRFLKDGGRMLPSHVQIMLAPIDDAVLYEDDGPGFWQAHIHGLDFSMLEQLELQQGCATQTYISEDSLLAEGVELVGLDLARMAAGDQWQKGITELAIQRDGVLDGFAGWFVARLSESVSLDTGPRCRPTHWSQTYFPFPPQDVKEGSTLSLAYELSPDPRRPRAAQLTLHLGDVSQTFVVS